MFRRKAPLVNVTSFTDNPFLLFSLMKAAACGTWLGDLITALIVTDIMLQDNLYPGWAPNLRLATQK